MRVASRKLRIFPRARMVAPRRRDVQTKRYADSSLSSRRGGPDLEEDLSSWRCPRSRALGNRGAGIERPVAHPLPQLPTSLAGCRLRFDFDARSPGFDLQGSARARKARAPRGLTRFWGGTKSQENQGSVPSAPRFQVSVLRFPRFPTFPGFRCQKKLDY